MKPTYLSTASEQARIAQLFMHVRDGVVMLDPIGVVGFWSDGAAELHNRPAPESLGRCYLEIIPAKTIAIQLPLIQRAIEGEECAGEWQMTRNDGVTLWVEAEFRPLCDDFGRRIGCVILLHDVTKWRTAEMARKASEEQLRTISDNIPGAVFQFRLGKDGHKSFPFISRGVADLLELTPDEINQRAIRGEFQVLPEDLPIYWDTLDESYRTMLPWDLEFRCQTAKSGQLKWIRLRAIPAKQPDGGTLWNGVMMDVSDRVFVNDALRESEARYRLLTENATDIISRMNLDGEYLYVSPVSHTLFGIEPEDMIGRHFREFVCESDLPRTIDILEKAISGTDIQTYIHRSLRKDGSYLWCETTARGVQDELGNVMEIITVTRSIEERKRLEARMQNSMKMEAVGRLAGGIAHDFNNLLTVINGFSEMILRNLTTHDSRVAGQVREIRKAGERASALTKQLLAFGRQQIQSRVRLNMNTVIMDTEKMLTRLIGEDVEIELELDPDLGFVNADMSQIEQVLVNLCVNARDAMPDGGEIVIRTGNILFDLPPEDDAKAGEYVMLEVTDTGTGMDEQTRSRIFEPFFTTKEMGKGTGLGLAMVYGIVKQSEGMIACESELGRGTTFRVFFPRCSAPATEPEGRSRFGTAITFGKETVLLAEDDNGVRTVTASMLRTLGYQVIEASGGVEALKQCREHHGPIHLLLTDVVMPVMNGRELADRVKAILPGIRVLFVSGYTDDAILRHGVLDENVAFLNKPLSHETLSRKIREVLEPISGIYQKIVAAG